LPELNIGNSIFPKLNDSNGIMLCGYEWGWSKEDQRDEKQGLLLLFQIRQSNLVNELSNGNMITELFTGLIYGGIP